MPKKRLRKKTDVTRTLDGRLIRIEVDRSIWGDEDPVEESSSEEKEARSRKSDRAPDISTTELGDAPLLGPERPTFPGIRPRADKRAPRLSDPPDISAVELGEAPLLEFDRVTFPGIRPAAKEVTPSESTDDGPDISAVELGDAPLLEPERPTFPGPRPVIEQRVPRVSDPPEISTTEIADEELPVSDRAAIQGIRPPVEERVLRVSDPPDISTTVIAEVELPVSERITRLHISPSTGEAREQEPSVSEKPTLRPPAGAEIVEQLTRLEDAVVNLREKIREEQGDEHVLFGPSDFLAEAIKQLREKHLQSTIEQPFDVNAQLDAYMDAFFWEYYGKRDTIKVEQNVLFSEVFSLHAALKKGSS